MIKLLLLEGDSLGIGAYPSIGERRIPVGWEFVLEPPAFAPGDIEHGFDKIDTNDLL